MICRKCGQEAIAGNYCVNNTTHALQTERANAGYSVRGVHVGTTATVEPSKPRPKPERKIKSWPLLIRGIARRKIAGDKGVGDTVERIIVKLGGDSFTWIMQRLGVKCGCDSRKDWLNARYPYDA